LSLATIVNFSAFAKSKAKDKDPTKKTYYEEEARKEYEIAQVGDAAGQVEPSLKTIAELQQKRGEVYAVIIGIGNYHDTRIPPLRFRVNDAQGLYDVLTDSRYGGVPKDHVKLLLNQEATSRNIKFTIGRWLSRQAGKEDMVIIYYAGHAAPEGADMYWVTYDAKSDDLYTTALDNNEIGYMIDRIRSKWVLTLIDSSYGAATTIQTKRPKDTFVRKGRMTISATTGQQLALELEAYEHGVFTYYLLEGLKGKADGMAETERDGIIEVKELWNFVRQYVAETARKQGHHQTPVFQGSLAGKIPLTYDVEYLKEMEK
jgi:uncharacterized caspase-like protein